MIIRCSIVLVSGEGVHVLSILHAKQLHGLAAVSEVSMCVHVQG